MAQGWTGLSTELLARVAADEPDLLLLRLVCRAWAAALARRVRRARLLPPAAAPDILGRSPTLADVHELAAFENLTEADLSGLPGSPECLAAAARLSPRLSSLAVGPLAEAHAGLLPSLAALTALSALRLAAATRACLPQALTGALALPALRRLSLECLDGTAAYCAGLGLPAGAGAAQQQLTALEISGNAGISQSDMAALGGLPLAELWVQLSDAAAFCSLTRLTGLRALTVADWLPGPAPGGAAQPLSLAQFSRLTGLTRLAVTHTFGNFQVVQLGGLARLTRLRELALRLPASLEGLAQLGALRQLPARAGLALPFDPGLDVWEQPRLTSLCFQGVLPAVVDGEEDADRLPLLRLHGLTRLRALEQLAVGEGAAAAVDGAAAALTALPALTALRLREGGGAWRAREPGALQQGLALLTGLQELLLDGCANLQSLDLARLGRLTRLGLCCCPQLRVAAPGALTCLRRLHAGHSGPLVHQFLQQAPALAALRRLDAPGTQLSDADVGGLLLLTALQQLDVRRTQLTPAAVRSLRRLPRLTHLEHSC